MIRGDILGHVCNPMAIEAKAFDNLTVRHPHRQGKSPRSRLKGVDDIGAEGVSRKRQRCANRIFGEPRVRIKDLFYRFSGGQFLQNQLDGNARAYDYRLAHHHAGIGNNYLSVIAHMSLFKPAYRFSCAK